MMKKSHSKNFDGFHLTDNFQIVNLLIENWANVDNEGENGRTALMMVAGQGKQPENVSINVNTKSQHTLNVLSMLYAMQ